MPETVSIEPNYEGVRAWVENVARTDLPAALKVNETLGCKAVDAGKLHRLATQNMDEKKAQCLADILVTAVEDGCTNSWRAVSCWRWSVPDQIEDIRETSVLVHEYVDDDNENVYAVGLATIEKGLQLIAEEAEGCRMNTEITDAVNRALCQNEADYFDAYSADAVMQAGMFGEVIYG